MGELSWIIRKEHTCNHMCFYKMDAEGDFTAEGWEEM